MPDQLGRRKTGNAGSRYMDWSIVCMVVISAV